MPLMDKLSLLWGIVVIPRQRILLDELLWLHRLQGGTAAAGKDNDGDHQDRDWGYGKEGKQHERLAQVVGMELADFPGWA